MRLGARSILVGVVVAALIPAGLAAGSSLVGRPAPKPQVTQEVEYAPPIIHANVTASVRNVTPSTTRVGVDLFFNREGNLDEPELWVMLDLPRNGDTWFALRSE